MGQLQQQKIDVGGIIGASWERMGVMQHVKLYFLRGFAILSLKPSYLPQNLLLLRPFAGKYSNRPLFVFLNKISLKYYVT